MVFWETTSACNLKCRHCRASATNNRPSDELTLQQSRELLCSIADFAKPVIVLSGGEPLVRPDIYDIASYGTKLGLRMVLATNATMLDAGSAKMLKEAGIQRVSVSIDGADAACHDAFRGVEGAFDSAFAGIGHLKSVEMPFQINTSVTRANINQLQQILDTAISQGACALHLFMLVPTGCGKQIPENETISADEYERVLNWVYDSSETAPINLKATCAPHYFRVAKQRSRVESGEPRAKSHKGHPFSAQTKGCLAGSTVCFVSYKGDVYPCGYFPVSAGSVLEQPLQHIWEESELFQQLRDPSLLTGKCGVCEFSRVCGGCRARAYAETGDYLAEEPYCNYTPNKHAR
ncbi:MAG: radical SAM protein [Armatimonadota bacterium]